VVWAQRAELSGEPFPSARAAGRELPRLVIDLDASVVVCHSEKELAAPTFKKTFGFHPMLAFCDNTGALVAWSLLRQRLGRLGWVGVTVAAVGAGLIAADASGADDSGHVLAGVVVALVAATAVAGEGIVATWAMAGLDTTTVMAVRELLSAAMFGLVLLAVPGGVATAGTMIAETGLALPIVVAGMVGRWLLVCDLVPLDPQDRCRPGDGLEHLLRDVGSAVRVEPAPDACDPARDRRMCCGDRRGRRHHPFRRH
jgi:hypothetical protein